MLADAKAYVKKYDRCQRHAPIVQQPPERHTSISTLIFFAMWEMDILGPFHGVSGQSKFIVENVICRFGIPRILVTDNRRKFNNAKSKEYYDDNNIELCFTSVSHPQENGKVDVTNRMILDGLKKRVECSKNTWVNELLHILWAYCATYKVTTEATISMLAYGAEITVPMEITLGSPWVEAYEPETNEEVMRLALNLINEVRDEVNTRNAEHRRRTSLYYNRRVKKVISVRTLGLKED
ncbi:uncharacterized protein LOC141685637 [Apium graveolens]|uniref:uncharacterized protein LOC141685637 n=1 Tax=Apium graveolens TaxID=4045 RepID=UPI003D7B4738